MLGKDGALERIAAGMGELEADQKVVNSSIGFHVGSSGQLCETRERVEVSFVDDELAGIRPSLGDDGARLAPDQLGPACSESLEAADGQVTR